MNIYEKRQNRCQDCAYFICDGEYYSAFEDNCFVDISCEKEHYEHVRFGAEPCKDFEE